MSDTEPLLVKITGLLKIPGVLLGEITVSFGLLTLLPLLLIQVFVELT